MPIHDYNGLTPKIDTVAFIASSADLVGEVEIGPESSLWFGVVARGDIAPVRIGARSNIQDGSVLHVAREMPCLIGNDVTIGHRVCVHACTVKDGALIGIGAVVLDGAIVEEDAFVAAGAVVTPGMVVPARTIVRGCPAKVWKELGPGEWPGREIAARYVELAKRYRNRGAGI